jgi:hypothetical protein
VKGATVNRELECLNCMLDFATKRRYIAENPASAVKHFNELFRRPTRRMLTLDEERLAPDRRKNLQRGFSLRWSIRLIRLNNNVKTPASAQPIPLSEYACDMRYTSSETKRHYQLGMADQVPNAVDKANKRLYGKRAALHFCDSRTLKKEKAKIVIWN